MLSGDKISTKVKTLIIFTLLFLLYFFSNNNIYAENPEKDDPDFLIPIGNVLQIDAELKNLIVSDTIEGSAIKKGDLLIQIDNKNFDGYKNFETILSSLPNGKEIDLTVNREGQIITTSCTREVLEKVSFNNLLSGFATLTYIDPKTSRFGAVGHPISIYNSRKIPIKDGSVSTTRDIDIQKSIKGKVGCINAKRLDVIGSFNENTDFGIKGDINNFDLSQLKQYKVASLDEVKPGKAEIILGTTNKKAKKYDIEILSIENQVEPKSKSFKIKVTDKNLLKQTGGIVQGMSGTPIVQDDKIIGAVSHAVENDPSVGYGLYIKWMF
jgi:stage IV sporulation protein B